MLKIDKGRLLYNQETKEFTVNDDGSSVLHHAIRRNNYKTVEAILAVIMDEFSEEWKTALRMKEASTGESLLTLAAQNCNAMNSDEDKAQNTVVLLLENYTHEGFLNVFDVNDKDCRNLKNETPLFKAAEYAKPNVVKYRVVFLEGRILG